MHLAYFSTPSQALEMWLLDLGTVSLQEWQIPEEKHQFSHLSLTQRPSYQKRSACFQLQHHTWSLGQQGSILSPASMWLGQQCPLSRWQGKHHQGPHQGSFRQEQAPHERGVFWSVCAAMNSRFGRAPWEQCCVQCWCSSLGAIQAGMSLLCPGSYTKCISSLLWQHIDHIMSTHGKQIMQAVTLILEGEHNIEVKEQVPFLFCVVLAE